MESHIEVVRIIKAKGRAYITGVFGEPRKRTLVVEISDRMSCNHVKLIETIAEKLGVGGCTKKDALDLRKQLLDEHPVGETA